MGMARQKIKRLLTGVAAWGIFQQSPMKLWPKLSFTENLDGPGSVSDQEKDVSFFRRYNSMSLVKKRTRIFLD